MDNKMKIVTVIVGVSLFIVLLAIITLMIIFDKDPALVLVNLPVIIGSVGTLLGLLFVSGKVDKVDHQTNGTLSALRSENAALSLHNQALLTVATPYQVKAASVDVETKSVSTVDGTL